MPRKVLSRVFRGKFVAGLKWAFRQGELVLQGLQHLAKPKVFRRFLRSLFSHDWVVYAKKPFGGPEHVLHYLARYTGQATFRWRDSADHNKQKLMTLDAIEFIRRFLLHILPTGFAKIRHFGFLANCNRGAALKLCATLLSEPVLQELLTDRQKSAIARRCPSCGVGTLYVLGWVPAAIVNGPSVLVPDLVDSS
jgi:hypothetical protein